MTQFTAVVWKECRELRWFLAGGLLLFFGVPLLTVLYLGAGPEQSAWMPLFFGGMMAVVTAIGAVSHDLSDGLRVFWQSRPMPIGRVLAVKWVTGLLIVLAVTSGPPLAAGLLDPEGGRRALAVAACHTFVLAAVYSVAFLLGCLLRQGAQAAVLSLAVGLLLYFAPALLPPLRFMDVFHVMRQVDVLTVPFGADYAAFCAGFIVCTAVAAVLTAMVVAHRWRIDVGRKTVPCLLAAAGLLGLGANALEVGRRLELERTVRVAPPDCRQPGLVTQMVATDGQGVLLLHGGRPSGSRRFVRSTLCSFRVTGTDIEFGPAVALPEMDNPIVAWSPLSPTRAYVLAQRPTAPYQRTARDDVLLTVTLDGTAEKPVIDESDLAWVLPEAGPAGRRGICLHGDRLYILASAHLVTASVADDSVPTLEPAVPCSNVVSAWTSSGPGRALPVPLAVLTQPVLDLPDLAPIERLRVTLGLLRSDAWGGYPGLDGDRLVALHGGSLSVYRVSGITGNAVELRLVGRRPPTPLEKLGFVYGTFDGHVAVREGIAYTWKTWESPATVTAFDTGDGHSPHRVGHLRLPGVRAVGLAPLPDGRLLLVGARALHVVRLPKAAR